MGIRLVDYKVLANRGVLLQEVSLVFLLVEYLQSHIIHLLDLDHHLGKTSKKKKKKKKRKKILLLGNVQRGGGTMGFDTLQIK